MLINFTLSDAEWKKCSKGLSTLRCSWQWSLCCRPPPISLSHIEEGRDFTNSLQIREERRTWPRLLPWNKRSSWEEKAADSRTMHSTIEKTGDIKKGSVVQPHLSVLCGYLMDLPRISNATSLQVPSPWETGSKTEDYQIWQVGIWIWALQLLD